MSRLKVTTDSIDNVISVLKADGHTEAEIAFLLGVSTSTVNRRCNPERYMKDKSYSKGYAAAMKRLKAK